MPCENSVTKALSHPRVKAKFSKLEKELNCLSVCLSPCQSFCLSVRLSLYVCVLLSVCQCAVPNMPQKNQIDTNLQWTYGHFVSNKLYLYFSFQKSL